MGTVLAGALAALCIGLSVRSVLQQRAQGKGCSGCGCCSAAGKECPGGKPKSKPQA